MLPPFYRSLQRRGRKGGGGEGSLHKILKLFRFTSRRMSYCTLAFDKFHRRYTWKHSSLPIFWLHCLCQIRIHLNNSSPSLTTPLLPPTLPSQSCLTLRRSSPSFPSKSATAAGDGKSRSSETILTAFLSPGHGGLGMPGFVANEKKNYYSLMSQIFVSFCRRCIMRRKRLFNCGKILVPSPIPIPYYVGAAF